jgi:hypothetical protein
LKFEILDDDGNNSFDYLGEVTTTVGEVMGSRG